MHLEDQGMIFTKIANPKISRVVHKAKKIGAIQPGCLIEWHFVSHNGHSITGQGVCGFRNKIHKYHYEDLALTAALRFPIQLAFLQRRKLKH